MKILYFDTETTGLDPKANGIIQLAYIISVDGKDREEGNLLIQPFPGDVISQSALDINRRTREEIFKDPFMDPRKAFARFIFTLDKYVDRYNRQDKFYPAGYNVGFDCDFLSNFFAKNGNKYYASYLNYLKIDPSCMMLLLDDKLKLNLQDYKLATVCKHFGISIEAHDAMSDIRATKSLIEKIRSV